MPLISFIVPCYGQAKYLPKAVASGLGQTVKDVEVIVIDDGSPDNPLEQLGRLRHDSRLRYIRQENAGLPAARNRGIRESVGTYLNFLDADDWLDAEFAEDLVYVLEETPHLGFAYSDVHHVIEEGAPSTTDPDYSVAASRRRTSGDILASLLLGGFFPPNCVLAPRSVVEGAGGFDTSLGGHADWDLWIRIAVDRKVAHVDKKLAFYRIHAGSMSQDREHMMSTQRRALEKLFRNQPDRSAEAIQDLIRDLNETHRINLRLCDDYTKLDNEYTDLLRLREQDVARHQSLFQEQKEWIEKLEEAKEWHLHQSSHWESEVSRVLALLEEQRNWNAQLMATNEDLQREVTLLQSAREKSD